MIEITEALQTLNDALQDALKNAGFSLYYPQDAAKNTLPVVTERDTQYVSYVADGSTLRVEYAGNAIGLYYAEAAPDVAQKGDFTRLSLSLFEPENADVRDVRYVAEEFSETLAAKFSGGKKPQVKKLPNAVSKTAVRNGAVYLCAVGGAGALAAQSIKSCEEIAFKDLGCESIKRMTVLDFPLIVAIDPEGNDLFKR